MSESSYVKLIYASLIFGSTEVLSSDLLKGNRI